MQVDNCLQLAGYDRFYSPLNTTYSKLLANRCVAMCTIFAASSTGITANNCYFYGYSTSGGASPGTQISPAAANRPFMMLGLPLVGSTILDTLTFSGGKDILGVALAKSPGYMEYVTNRMITLSDYAAATPGEGFKLWAVGGGGGVAAVPKISIIGGF